MAWGLAFVGAGLLLLAFASSLEFMLGAMTLYGLGFGLIFPAVNALVADASMPGERGTAFGLFYAFYSAGVVAGAGLAGFLAESSTLGPAFIAGMVGLGMAVVVGLGGRQVELGVTAPQSAEQARDRA
jgi:MFS family permease